MVVFSFSPTNPAGFLVSSGNSISWENCPLDLVEKLKELMNRGEALLNAAISCDGDWFLRTDLSVYWKATTTDFVSQTVQAVEYAKADGIDLSYATITSITFVPNSNGYICIGQPTNGTATCLWGGDGVPPSLAAYLADVPPTTAVQCVSVGYGGSWAVILGTGAVYSKGIPDNLKRQLRSTPQGAVQFITLSLSDPEHYVVNFADGNTCSVLESRCFSAISEEAPTCDVNFHTSAQAQLANQRMPNPSVANSFDTVGSGV